MNPNNRVLVRLRMAHSLINLANLSLPKGGKRSHLRVLPLAHLQKVSIRQDFYPTMRTLIKCLN